MQCVQMDLPLHIVLKLLNTYVCKLLVYGCHLFVINSRISTKVLNVHCIYSTISD